VSEWPTTLLASDVAFGIVFGLFLAAFLVLAFVAVRWGVRRDRPGRAAWRLRHLEAAAKLPEPQAGTALEDGHLPDPEGPA